MSHHKLLERQIKRYLPSQDTAEPWLSFLAAVDSAYRDADTDRQLIERSFELMSQELTDRNGQLRTELGERKTTEQALIKEKAEQAALIVKLEEAHNQLLQSEKLASIGQLAAGVAHEINNPIGFVNSNLGTLRDYVGDMLKAIDAHEAEQGHLPADARQRIASVLAQIDLPYLRSDAVALLAESTDGIRRVRQIVQGLKDFSHVGESQWQRADLRKGLESTLNIVQNEVKYVADVVRRYAEIPEIDCLASQLNQVFLNMFVNASHAIKGKRGTITVSTGLLDAMHVFVEIADDGSGIAPENLKRIFDPFFTTKPVGKGTGLGLSLAYGIVGKHRGHIEVRSELDVGTVFRVVLPIRQVDADRAQEDPAGVTPSPASG